MKTCRNPTCSQNNPQSLSNFAGNRKGRGGLYSYCKICKNAIARKQYLNPEIREKRRLMTVVRRYWPHLSPQQALTEYNKLKTAQNNLCLICKEPSSEKDPQSGRLRELNIDHCHKIGKVRGLLCGLCNRGIGQFRESSDLCFKAFQYLFEYSE